MNDLGEHAALWTRDIVNVVGQARHELPRLHSLASHVDEILKLIEYFCPLDAELTSNRALHSILSYQQQHARQSFLRALRRKQDDADAIERLKTNLKAAYERFNVCHKVVAGKISGLTHRRPQL